ncbi:hypothetical protein FEM48_Zijuj02G0081400 [Ziziphus jujuba var. spinosa]|uniref:MBD domain-containing protein n=1 Tax=Ziziphus jujuba var. spinosa TaxID=714518 RepID=A0A978VUL3_ZIZJJ|nr:hypothetical protein FEM48_Zijuj02G0081400 [Ziziphus jujuba var. spinosa]
MPSTGEKSVCSYSTLTLPDDWSVVEKQRCSLAASPGRVDKVLFFFFFLNFLSLYIYIYIYFYLFNFRFVAFVEFKCIVYKMHLCIYYYEPGTGKTFRSLISVYKYLREGKTDTPMTKKLRADNKSSYYIEPGSGQRFRSLRAVERYLTEASHDTMPLKAFQDAHKLDKKDVSVNKWSLKAANKDPTKGKEITTRVKTVKSCNYSRPLKHFGNLMKNNSGEDVQDSMTDFSCQPSKINWILAGGPGGNMWSPFMGEYMVPESVKRKWSETFISSIHKGSLNGPGHWCVAFTAPWESTYTFIICKRG